MWVSLCILTGLNLFTQNVTDSQWNEIYSCKSAALCENLVHLVKSGEDTNGTKQHGDIHIKRDKKRCQWMWKIFNSHSPFFYLDQYWGDSLISEPRNKISAAVAGRGWTHRKWWRGVEIGEDKMECHTRLHYYLLFMDQTQAGLVSWDWWLSDWTAGEQRHIIKQRES